MFADMVIGIDADEEGKRTLRAPAAGCSTSTTVYGTWNWSDCTFSETANPFDKDAFGYKSGGNDDGDDSPL